MALLLFAGVAGTAQDSESPGSFRVRYIDKVPYLSLVEIAETYGLTLDNEPALHRMSLTRGPNSIGFAHNNRTALVNGSARTMPLPARMIRGALYVPATASLDYISTLLPGNLRWDEKKQRLVVEDVLGSVASVLCDNKDNGTLITVNLNEPLKARAEMEGERLLTLTIEDAVYVRQSDFLPVESPLIETTACYQRSDSAQISFLLAEDAGAFDLLKTGDPNVITLSIRNNRAADPADTPVAVDLQGDFMLLPHLGPESLLDMRIDTVVIDPGHGGKDPGAVGPKKTKEKDIVLSVGKELKKIMDKSGEVKAVMTRDKDVFVPLHERAKIAMQAGGKLFISLHANANRNRSANGVEVYFLSATKDEAALTVARRENGVIDLEENQKAYEAINISDMSYTEGAMWNSVYQRESQHLGSMVLEKSCQATKFKMRGVKQAPFYVMLGTQASMPSILVEIGFISNTEEERLLKRSTYQKKIAQAIYDAVIQFKRDVEKQIFSGG